MRKLTCQELAEKGWIWGVWDPHEKQWDGVSIMIEDAIAWRNDGCQVYELESGERWRT